MANYNKSVCNREQWKSIQLFSIIVAVTIPNLDQFCNHSNILTAISTIIFHRSLSISHESFHIHAPYPGIYISAPKTTIYHEARVPHFHLPWFAEVVRVSNRDSGLFSAGRIAFKVNSGRRGRTRTINGANQRYRQWI